MTDIVLNMDTAVETIDAAIAQVQKVPVKLAPDDRSIQVQKIKILKDSVNIHYEQKRDGRPSDAFVLDSDDEPCESFQTAMDRFLDLVIDICCLDRGVWEEQAEKLNAFVSGVSIKETDDGYGLNITAQLKDPESGYCVVINSPHLRGEDWETQALISNVQAEAIAYIKGKRKTLQLNLLEGSDNEMP